MKTIPRLTAVVLMISLVALLVISCLKTTQNPNQLQILKNTDTEYSTSISVDSNTFLYTSRVVNGKSESILQISSATFTINLNYTIDSSVPDYRLLQHKKIQQIVKTIPANISLLEMGKFSDGLFKMMQEIFKKSDITKKKVEPIFYYYAILKTKCRSLESGNADYPCIPYPAYVLGRSFFFCQEDVIIDKSTVNDIVKEHPELLQSEKNKKIFAFVNSVKESSVSFDKIYAFSMSNETLLKTFDNIIERNKIAAANQANGVTKIKNKASDCAWWCPLGCGTDWGCCGNYSGCCLYASLECYIHDRLCTNCTPRWFCFSGCVPD